MSDPASGDPAGEWYEVQVWSENHGGHWRRWASDIKTPEEARRIAEEDFIGAVKSRVVKCSGVVVETLAASNAESV